MSAIPPAPTNVIPFEIPQEDPILPSGESHLPPNSYFVTTQAPVVEYSPAVLEQMRAPNSDHFAQMQALYSAAEQEMIIAWWPHIYLRASEHVTDKPVVCTVEHVLLHAKGVSKQHNGRREHGEPVGIPNSYAAAHMHWIAECTARKKWIEAKRVDWHKRKEERSKWKAEQAVTEAQWDAYVDEAKTIYKQADAYPIPERPVRT